MRKPVKMIKNLQKHDYVNMYIVYLLFLKNFEILRNIAKYCDNMQKITSCNPEGIIRYKLGTGLHCFYLSYFAIFHNTFQNISKFLSKSFERNVYRNLLKDCDSFERFRIDRNSFKRFRHAISFERFRIFILLMLYS